MSNCRHCGRQTANEAYVCEDSLSELAEVLGEMTWLDEQLDITITRQRAATYDGGPDGNGGLPWHDAASEARRALHATLATWVRFCSTERIRNASPSDQQPRDSLISMSRWLMWRVDGLAWHELGGDAVSEITRAAGKAKAIVLWKPAARIYLGPCDLAPVCDGDVYALEGEDHGTCHECGHSYPVEARRQAMRDVVADRLATANEIARLSTYLGLPADREQVRSLVRSWERTKRIEAKSTGTDGQAMFRYGDVEPMLYEHYAKRERVMLA